jgi:hypothetical protein
MHLATPSPLRAGIINPPPPPIANDCPPDNKNYLTSYIFSVLTNNSNSIGKIPGRSVWGDTGYFYIPAIQDCIAGKIIIKECKDEKQKMVNGNRSSNGCAAGFCRLYR